MAKILNKKLADGVKVKLDSGGFIPPTTLATLPPNSVVSMTLSDEWISKPKQTKIHETASQSGGLYKNTVINKKNGDDFIVTVKDPQGRKVDAPLEYHLNTNRAYKAKDSKRRLR